MERSSIAEDDSVNLGRITHCFRICGKLWPMASNLAGTVVQRLPRDVAQVCDEEEVGQEVEDGEVGDQQGEVSTMRQWPSIERT
jgi:hypothetical protein